MKNVRKLERQSGESVINTNEEFLDTIDEQFLDSISKEFLENSNEESLKNQNFIESSLQFFEERRVLRFVVLTILFGAGFSMFGPKAAHAVEKVVDTIHEAKPLTKRSEWWAYFKSFFSRDEWILFLKTGVLSEKSKFLLQSVLLPMTALATGFVISGILRNIELNLIGRELIDQNEVISDLLKKLKDCANDRIEMAEERQSLFEKLKHVLSQRNAYKAIAHQLKKELNEFNNNSFKD